MGDLDEVSYELSRIEQALKGLRRGQDELNPEQGDHRALTCTEENVKNYSNLLDKSEALPGGLNLWDVIQSPRT